MLTETVWLVGTTQKHMTKSTSTGFAVDNWQKVKTDRILGAMRSDVSFFWRLLSLQAQGLNVNAWKMNLNYVWLYQKRTNK